MKASKTLILILFAAACATTTPSPTPEVAKPSLKYTVVMSTTTIAGTQSVTQMGDETIVDFEYNDRGRGPKTHTVWQVDGHGIPTSMHTTGNDYYKVGVDETLATNGTKVSWKNTAEAGDGEPGKFYSSMYGPPEESALLARALLDAGGHLKLHPAGEASIRKVGDATVRGLHINAYEISGLAFTPYEVWLDDDRNLFGMLSSWLSVVREGFESEVKPLIDAQDARENARSADMAKRLALQPARVIVANARVFDPRTKTLSEPTFVITNGNRIESVGTPSPYSAGELIDAKGGVLLPGLWDMHVHLGAVDGPLNIANGITSVRDLGNDPDTILNLRKQFDAGTAIGPRVVLAGLVDGPGPFQGPTKMLAANEEEAKKIIDFFADHGYEQLKIYSSVKPELVPYMAKYAHERGLRVSGHIPAGMRADDAVDDGYDEIQHINMLMLNFMPDVTDTRTPARFMEPAKRGAELDLQSPEVRAFIAKLVAHKTVIDPTVTIFESMFTARPGVISPSFAAVADRFPPQVRRGFLTGGIPVPEGMDERYRASFQRMLDFVRTLHDSGVTIVAGTDDLAGFTLHRELELYVKAGIPAPEVLRIATLVPAQVMHRERDLGTIEPGKLADFIIVDGDPTTNISDIRRIVRVVKDGKVFDPRAIDEELGVH